MNIRRIKRLLAAVLIASVAMITGPGVRAEEAGLNAGLHSLQLQWEYSTAPFTSLCVVQDQLNRPFLYVAQKAGGISILDISDPRAPSKVAEVSQSKLGRLDAMYVVQKGDTLYAALGDFFAAGGSRAGLATVSVKEPRTPQVLSLWTSPQKIKGASSLLIDGDWAYLAAMDEGVLIFDIRGENHARLVSTVRPDIHFPKPNPNRIQKPNARGLAIRGDLLYVAYDAGGLRVIDVSEKGKPREIAKYINASMGEKQQAYNHLVIDWPYAYIAVDYCGMEIVDLSDPAKIRQVAWWNPWRCQDQSNTWFNSPGHTNQLAFDATRKQVFLSAGDSELLVIDVKDPGRPALAVAYGETKNGRGTWGVTVTEQWVYLSYIKAFIPFSGNWSGIAALLRRGQ